MSSLPPPSPATQASTPGKTPTGTPQRGAVPLPRTVSRASTSSTVDAATSSDGVVATPQRTSAATSQQPTMDDFRLSVSEYNSQFNAIALAGENQLKVDRIVAEFAASVCFVLVQ